MKYDIEDTNNPKIEYETLYLKNNTSCQQITHEK